MRSTIKKTYFLILTGIILIFLASPAFGQCAMCKTSVVNNASSGDTALASSLNSGILLLLFTPYTLILIVGLAWYYQSKKNGKKRR